MFQRLPEAPRQVLTILVDGKPVECRDGDSVAAALFAAGYTACRTTAVSGAARGPYCMMGVCYDCLVAIDGGANQQACMVKVRAGMRVERQQGAREVRS
jgi:NADH dehydrogenase/NADH:ubiquinone oxidoreductase subunit G